MNSNIAPKMLNYINTALMVPTKEVYLQTMAISKLGVWLSLIAT